MNQIFSRPYIIVEENRPIVTSLHIRQLTQGIRYEDYHEHSDDLSLFSSETGTFNVYCV